MDRDSLLIDLKVGDAVSIESGRVIMTLKEKSGQRAKLHFDAEKGVSIEPVRVRTSTLAARLGIAAAT